MDHEGRLYPSDLTNQQWEGIKDLIPTARFGGRRRTTDVRKVMNAIFYLNRSGCAWRYLPKEYPPWKTVYDYFSRWRDEGVLRRIHQVMAQKARLQVGRSSTPTTVIIDGQSVKAQYGEERGWDGFKKVRGRKRQILVDTMGILWGAKVHAANEAEQKRGSDAVFDYPLDRPSPKRILGDFSYSKTPFDVEVFNYWGIWPEIRQGTKPLVKNEKSLKIAQVGISNLKPQRWIVERTFAWFNNYRRLSRDYERRVCNSEIHLYISQIQLLLNKVATQPP